MIRSTPGLLLCALGSVLAGCQTYVVKPLPQIAAATAPVQASCGGVKVGAKAFCDPKEEKEVFHADLMSRGLLPIFVAIDNGSQSEVEVLRARVSFMTGKGKSLAPSSPEAASMSLGRSPVAEAILIGGVFSYADADRYNTDMRRDWSEKGMGEVTIIQSGESAGKFLYFDVGKGFDTAGSMLTITISGAGDASRQSATLRF